MHKAKSYKYKIFEEYMEGVWVCEECRRKNFEHILLKKWRLIDRDELVERECGLCQARAKEQTKTGNSSGKKAAKVDMPSH